MFYMKVNINVFLLVVARYPQSAQNNNFVMSLQYLKKRRAEVHFYHADNHQTIL